LNFNHKLASGKNSMQCVSHCRFDFYYVASNQCGASLSDPLFPPQRTWIFPQFFGDVFSRHSPGNFWRWYSIGVL